MNRLSSNHVAQNSWVTPRNITAQGKHGRHLSVPAALSLSLLILRPYFSYYIHSLQNKLPQKSKNPSVTNDYSCSGTQTNMLPHRLLCWQTEYICSHTDGSFIWPLRVNLYCHMMHSFILTENRSSMKTPFVPLNVPLPHKPRRSFYITCCEIFP